MMLRAHLESRHDDFSLSAELAVDVETLAIIGPNGAGKTTLLRLLLGVEEPTSGRLTVGEYTFFDTAEGTDEPPETRRFGYVPQHYALFPHLDVAENVAFGIRSRDPGRGVEDCRHMALRFLARLEVEDLADRDVGTLSGGEQQRVALARALAIEPRALLLDEPLAALDRTVRRKMRDFLADHLSDIEVPTLLVTHEPADVRILADRVVVMDGGEVVQHGEVDELRAEPANEFVREFFTSRAEER